MNIFLKIIRFVCSPSRVYGFVLERFCYWLPEKLYLKLLFKKHMGYSLNLDNPQTFSEKLQWLKLYNRREEYTKMVDKYAVKEYVASVIGDEYIIPTLGVWSTPEQIEWEKLPSQFVLKTTHSGGSLGVVVCKDIKSFNKEAAIKQLKIALKDDISRHYLEWPYKNVPKKIIAEKYITPNPGMNDLPDYKFFCFDGKVRALFVATERQNPNEDVKFDFFDADFNPLPFRQGHERAKQLPKKPRHFEEMKVAAERLSQNIPHVRVDFYENGNQVLFGELTFFHFSGLEPFIPSEWDKKFGDMLVLPTEIKRD